MAQERGPFPDRLPQGWFSSATGKADHLRPWGADVGRRVVAAPPALGQKNSDKLGHTWLLLAWAPGEAGEEDSKGPQRETPLEGPQTPQICGPHVHSQGGRLTALPETPLLRGSTALGRWGWGPIAP